MSQWQCWKTDPLPVIRVEALSAWEEGSDFAVYVSLATESLQFSERYIVAPKEITMDERKQYSTPLAQMPAALCPLVH